MLFISWMSYLNFWLPAAAKYYLEESPSYAGEIVKKLIKSIGYVDR